MNSPAINPTRRSGKSIAPLCGYAHANGWQIRLTKGGHMRFAKPGRPCIFTSSTPSDHRAYLNALSMLRRADRQAQQLEASHA